MRSLVNVVQNFYYTNVNLSVSILEPKREGKTERQVKHYNNDNVSL